MIDVMICSKTLTCNEWLEFKRGDIVGSDVYFICGISKYKSPCNSGRRKQVSLNLKKAGEAIC